MAAWIKEVGAGDELGTEMDVGKDTVEVVVGVVVADAVGVTVVALADRMDRLYCAMAFLVSAGSPSHASFGNCMVPEAFLSVLVVLLVV